MCSEYIVFTTPEEIAAELGAAVDNQTSTKEWNQRVKLTTKAPVVMKNKNGTMELREYTFPVQPFPNSRLSGLDPKTEDDAEPLVRRIYDLPTWKKDFANSPCIVPMSAFCEPVYWGPDAGSVQEFKPPTGKLFFVAGMSLHARVPKTNEAFSLLTHTASPQMLHYHHRLLVLLKPKHALEYLDVETAPERFDFLLKHRWVPELKVHKDRNLAKGWEKKIDTHLASLESERRYAAVLKHEGVEA
jgi:putative SOS response-associated peptidase YedK